MITYAIVKLNTPPIFGEFELEQDQENPRKFYLNSITENNQTYLLALKLFNQLTHPNVKPLLEDVSSFYDTHSKRFLIFREGVLEASVNKSEFAHDEKSLPNANRLAVAEELTRSLIAILKDVSLEGQLPSKIRTANSEDLPLRHAEFMAGYFGHMLFHSSCSKSTTKTEIPQTGDSSTKSAFKPLHKS